MTDTAKQTARGANPAPVNDPALAALHQMFGYFDRNATVATAKGDDAKAEPAAKAAA